MSILLFVIIASIGLAFFSYNIWALEFNILTQTLHNHPLHTYNMTTEG